MRVKPSNGTYDIEVVNGTTDVRCRQAPSGPIVWDSSRAKLIELQEASGATQTPTAAPGTLTNVFFLAPRSPSPNETRGTVSLNEQALIQLKATNVTEYNAIVKTFLERGRLFLSVAMQGNASGMALAVDLR